MKFWKRNFDLIIVGAVILGLGCAYIITPPYVLPALACCEGEDGCDSSCEWAVQIDPPTLSCGDQEITLRGTANYCSEDASIEVYLNDAEIYASDEKPESWEATVNVQAGKQYEVDAIVFEGEDEAVADQIEFGIEECMVTVCGVENNLGTQTEITESEAESCNAPDCIRGDCPDVCTNLDGNQVTVPAGLVAKDGLCTTEPTPEPKPTPCTDCRPPDAPRPSDLPTPAEFRGGEGGEDEVIEPEEKAEVLPAQVKPAPKKTLPQTGGWAIFDIFYAGWAYGGYRIIKRIWQK